MKKFLLNILILCSIAPICGNSPDDYNPGQNQQQQRTLPGVEDREPSTANIGVSTQDFAQHGVDLAAVRQHNQASMNRIFSRLGVIPNNQNNNQ